MRAEAGQPPARRLRTQLLRWLLLPLLALLAVDAAVSWALAHRFAQDAQDKALVEIGRELALQVRTDAQGRLQLELPEALRRVLFEDPQDRLAFEIVDAGGARVAGTAIPTPGPGPASVKGRSGEVLYDSHVDGTAVRAVQMPLAQVPGARLRVAETRERRNEMARGILGIVVLPQVVLIVLAGLIVRVGVDRGLRPLQDLQQAVASRSHRDLSPIDEVRVPGEVRPLVQAVNALLERLAHALTLQQRFIADAAHQLKTPVAGLSAHIELLTRQPDSPDRAELLGRLQLGVQRLSRLVSQLLALARNEPDAARSMQTAPVELNALVLDIASGWVPQALQRGIDLGLEDSKHPLVIHGDASRLREMLDNLLDNAIRYSRDGGRVTVQLHDQPSPTLVIRDDGPSIPPEARERIFERFHRLLGDSEGSGLGLAIALEIARLHGARIDLGDDDVDGIGNRFSVVFPPA